MSIGMSTKVWKNIVKEINIIVSQEEPSQLQCASEACNHLFIIYVL
jgi:hypothetical protein